MKRILICSLVLCLVAVAWAPRPAHARKDSVDVLMQRVKGRDAKARVRALDDLRWWGVAAANAVPDLVQALKDPVLSVRLGAVRVLGAIGPAAAPAVPALLDLIREERQISNDWIDYGVADEAIGALGAMGEGARPAVPVLVETLSSKQHGVRRSGLLAVGSLGPVAAEALPRLAKCLRDPGTRLLAAWAVWRTGRETPMILPVLRDGMRSEDDDERIFSLALVALVGPAASSLRPDLVASLRDPYPRVRLFAARALLKQGAEPNTYLPMLVKCLDPRYFGAAGAPATDGGFWEAERAAELIGGVGRPAESAIPCLVAALRDSDPRMVSPACTALCALGEVNSEHKPAIRAALLKLLSLSERGGVSTAIRTRAARQLSRMGDCSQTVVAPLLDCLRSDSPGLVRATAAAAVLGLEPRNEEAMVALSPLAADLGHLLFKPQEGAFDSYDPGDQRAAEVRIFWLDTLARLGPRAREALPFVTAARRLSDARVRAAADIAEKRILE